MNQLMGRLLREHALQPSDKLLKMSTGPVILVTCDKTTLLPESGRTEGPATTLRGGQGEASLSQGPVDPHLDDPQLLPGLEHH